MKRIFVIISLLLCLTMVFNACSKSKPAADSRVSGTDGENNKTEDISDEADNNTSADVPEDISDDSASEAADSSDMQTITDFSDYWTQVYDANEEAINNYEGMPIMELLYPGMCFLTGIQYDLLNLENKDGRFEGDLMLAGYSGFVEKNGKKLTFGYDETREEDGFSENDKAGDRLVEEGNCDLASGYYYSIDSTERDGAVISKTVNEVKIEKDGSISALCLDGDALNYSGEEEMSNTFTFVRNGKDLYDFVIARGTVGPDFDIPSLEDDMTKEKAIEMFEKAGMAVESSGGIPDGKLTLDK